MQVPFVCTASPPLTCPWLTALRGSCASVGEGSFEICLPLCAVPSCVLLSLRLPLPPTGCSPAGEGCVYLSHLRR